MRIAALLVPLLILTPGARAPSPYDDLQALSADFWSWRAETQPVAGDDIPRLERPAGWLPDWSPASVRDQFVKLDGFETRYAAIDTAGWSVPERVDHGLVGSALARVRWELEVNPGWRTNPLFYTQQTEGSIFDLLRSPTGFDAVRTTHIVRTLENIPALVEQAKQNLDRPNGTFAGLAIGELEGARRRFETMAEALAPRLRGPDASGLDAATERAIEALEGYRDWLTSRVDRMPRETAIGRDAYVYFLEKVALLPYSPEQLVSMARQEFERAIAFEVYERAHNQALPELEMFSDQAAQIAEEAKDERELRELLEARGILSVPDWMGHYTNLVIPDYLQPLAHLGVTDDLGLPSKPGADGISYTWPPSPSLGYFGLSTARDPRPIIVHEGVPGHYFQLNLSWAHENPIRRHYYDSGANEGIGFYAEEMMLQAGLWEDSPRSREIVYNFARLRALRVEVDVRLAIGEFTIEQAGRYLEEAVPMPRVTAEEEAAFFASAPGQAISYQIGKIQILQMLAEARRTQGETFSLRAFHDFLWKNGNVPIALLRWEMLGVAPGNPEG